MTQIESKESPPVPPPLPNERDVEGGATVRYRGRAWRSMDYCAISNREAIAGVFCLAMLAIVTIGVLTGAVLGRNQH